MFRHLTPDERQAFADKLADQGVTSQQFTQAQNLARTLGENLASAYSEALGRPVTPVQFITDILGIEGAGRLLVCALREITGRPDLYRDI
jgi:hypothetical protein